MKIKIDIHIHSENSFDSQMNLVQILDLAKEKGLDAVAICDHDHVFNSPIPDHPVKVIPGVEFTTEYGHLLGLFVKEDIPRGDFKTLCDGIHAQGGIAVIAHPFLHKHYIDTLHLTAKYIDGVEVWNSRADRKDIRANKKALEFAKQYDLLMFAGSDSHLPREIGNAYSVYEYKDDLKTTLLCGLQGFYGRREKSFAVAQSQYIKLHRVDYGKFSLWFAFFIKCLLEDMFRKREKNDVTYSEDRKERQEIT